MKIIAWQLFENFSSQCVRFYLCETNQVY